MSAPVLTKEQVKTMRACLPFAVSGDDANKDLQGLCDFTEVLRAELEAVSARCDATVKDRDRWNELYNAEHRKHVTAVVALRSERDALAAKVAVLAEEVKAWRDADGRKVHEANWEAVCNAVAATNASGVLNG